MLNSKSLVPAGIRQKSGLTCSFPPVARSPSSSALTKSCHVSCLTGMGRFIPNLRLEIHCKSPTYFIKSFSAGRAHFKQSQITPTYTAAALLFAHLRRVLLFSGVRAGGLGGRKQPPQTTLPPTSPNTSQKESHCFPRGERSLFK